MNSLDDLLAVEVPEDATEAWKEDLTDRIEEIINRKRSSTQGRESALNLYVHYLMNHYAHDQIRHKAGELFPAFLKSIKADGSEKEACLALRGLCRVFIHTLGNANLLRSNRSYAHNDAIRDCIYWLIPTFKTSLHGFTIPISQSHCDSHSWSLGHVWWRCG